MYACRNLQVEFHTAMMRPRIVHGPLPSVNGTRLRRYNPAARPSAANALHVPYFTEEPLPASDSQLRRFLDTLPLRGNPPAVQAGW